MAQLYGFTLLRNGVKYDYSYRECLISLSGICNKVYVALGDSDDGTEAAISDLDFVKTIPTVWDMSKKDGAIILSEQTNIALEALRSDQKDNQDAWGIYLQCDEVLHEEDYERIVSDINYANRHGYDAVRFRYMHFWKTHHHVAINKKWYPQEIRAIKLSNKDIESWGDAQSFKNTTKVYDSNATVYHYGHVREIESYNKKKKDILELYHEEHKLSKYKRREKKFDNMTEALLFFGNHPEIMTDRIKRLGDILALDQVEDLYVVGVQGDFSGKFLSKINAKNIHWVTSPCEVPTEFKDKMVIIEPTCWQKFRYPSKVPVKMRSILARPWSKEWLFCLKLSEKGVGLK